MNSIISKKEKTEKQLKEFGQVMALAGLVFSCLLIIKRKQISCLLLGLLVFSLIFMILASFAAKTLRLPEYYWMKFAEKLGAVVTYLIMLITFYCIFTPIGLLLKLIGKDLLQRKLDPSKQSYWDKTTPLTDKKRYYTPF